MYIYRLDFFDLFVKKSKKLLKKNPALIGPLEKTFNLLRKNPFYPSLNTHKSSSRLYGEIYSSRVSGDLRILWDFEGTEISVLNILDIGGHSGSHKVYK